MQQAARKPQARSSLKLRIEELVLHGFAPADRHRIADTVQSELARLIGDGTSLSLREKSSVLDRIEAGSFKVRPGSNARAMGSQIANAIYRGLHGGTKASADLLAARLRLRPKVR